MFEKKEKKERKNAAHAVAAFGLGNARTSPIDPDPIKKRLEKINSLIDRKKEGLLRKEKDMAAEDKTSVSSKFLIAVLAFMGGEVAKFLWKKFNHRKNIPNVASKNASIGQILLYSLLSSVASSLFSFLGYRIFGKKKKDRDD